MKQLLIQNGADVNAAWDNYSALCIAVRNGHHEVVEVRGDLAGFLC